LVLFAQHVIVESILEVNGKEWNRQLQVRVMNKEERAGRDG